MQVCSSRRIRIVAVCEELLVHFFPVNPNPVNCGMTGSPHRARVLNSTKLSGPKAVLSPAPSPPSSPSHGTRGFELSIFPRLDTTRRKSLGSQEDSLRPRESSASGGTNGEQRPHIGTSTGNLGHVCAPDLNQGNSKGDQAIEVD